MESALTWEHATLINELTQGMENAKQLRFHLCTTKSPSKDEDLLLHKILSCYEKALWILNGNNNNNNNDSSPQSQSVTPKSRIRVSSVSVDDASPKSSEELNRAADTTPKKGKKQATWTEQVRVNSENGLEGPTDHGYSWRKYGQKDILGAKYPRSYYRCTYRSLQNCWATKKVQRSDNDPTVFEITYKGKHTCNNTALPIQEPQHEKQEPQHENQTLVNLKANLRVETEDLANKEMPAHFSFPETENCYFPNYGFVEDDQLGAYSSLFYSSPTSESNYFSAPAYQINNNYGQNGNFHHSTSGVTEIISAHASTTNSPIGDVEFTPFDNSGFFT